MFAIFLVFLIPEFYVRMLLLKPPEAAFDRS